MNHIQATITQITRKEHVTLVTFEANKHKLSLIALELNPTLKEGNSVTLGFKATNIILAKELSGTLSISNQLPALVQSVDNGELLSHIKLKMCDALIECITTKDAALSLNLQTNDNVTAMIKASDLSIIKTQSEGA